MALIPTVARSLAPLLAVPLLTACTAAADAHTKAAAVEGTVTAGPTCPVERADHPCPPAPVRDAEVRLVRTGGKTSAQTHTDDRGFFHLSSAPGAYTVIATNPSGYHSQASAPVTLTAGQTQHVDLQLDTGIR
jgi:Carboxypeptidase regulatory-like domain